MEGSKMKKSLLLMGILSIALIAALITGCAMEQATAPEDGAVVTFSIGKGDFTAKTILPEEDMEIANYLVTAYLTSDPGNLVINETIPYAGTTVTVVKLLSPGEYSFKVKAFNTTPFLIGEGFYNDDPAATVVIEPTDKVVNIPITVRPAGGEGTFDLTITWPNVDFGTVTPEIAVTLTAESGQDPANNVVDDTVTVDEAGRNATYTNDTLANGYYRVLIVMRDSITDGILWSTIDALRIIKDDESRVGYVLEQEFDEIVAVDIDPELENPFIVVLRIDGVEYISDEENTNGYTLLPDYFFRNKDQTLTVIALPRDVTNAALSADSYEWYLNGIQSLTSQEDPDDPINQYSQVTVGGTNSGASTTLTGTWWINVLVKIGDVLVSETVRVVFLP
jgi:hypothetical protein